MKQDLQILFQKPATEWEETLPIGNGSLGGMVFGNPNCEKIGLNDEILWSGYQRENETVNSKFRQNLEKARELILKGERSAAERVIEQELEGEYTESYLPLGNLLFSFPEKEENYSHYSRKLDLNQALVEVSYEAQGQTWQEELFASYPQQSLYGKISVNKNFFSSTLQFESQLTHQITFLDDLSGFLISGQCPEHVDPSYVTETKNPVIQGNRGMKFSYLFKIIGTDGVMSVENNHLTIQNATFMEWTFTREAVKLEENYLTAKQNHVVDYQDLFQKVDLYLGPQANLPTQERVKNLKNGEKDLGLVTLYFQYGRYLLISSSRKGSLPANLQGIWNWQLRAPWSSNYTTNINAEMNYWLADTCNLSECFLPYESFIQKVLVAGEKTAKKDYEMNGSVLHHNTDFWQVTHPVGKIYRENKGAQGSVMWAYWPMGGVWYANDLYRHYEYQPNPLYLKEVVYPTLRKVTAFLCDFVVKVEGTYHTVPSTSPENSFYDHQGQVVSVDKSTAMDIALIKENFDFFKKICETLSLEDDLLPKVLEIEKHLATIKIGSQNQILEYQEEFQEVEPGHRHFSPLYGLYPGEVFSSLKYQEASLETIKRRMEHGGGYTGWSNAWLINLYAVLRQKEEAYQRIITAITESSYPNLWGKHPPFQIDSNFGVTAGIASLFVQDRFGEVSLLPSLPQELSEGYVKGLRIKDGKEISIRWKEGKVVSKIISTI